jgi:hypothetical protein
LLLELSIRLNFLESLRLHLFVSYLLTIFYVSIEHKRTCYLARREILTNYNANASSATTEVGLGHSEKHRRYHFLVGAGRAEGRQGDT